MATQMVVAMVTNWGLSEVIGPVYHGVANEDLYTHSRGGEHNYMSPHTAELIDKEVKRIIEQGYNVAKNILTQHVEQLHLLAKMLIEHETLMGQQIKNLLSNRVLNSEAENLFPTNKLKAENSEEEEEEEEEFKRIQKKNSE
ncbi:hypothetical protein KSP39_PZI007458 [Platanthera zijinensis]|uniref:Peptidase M41 domain-containing protein n=1 Tax=Platanthera zijinensis TaxID=2320716 RepID=A0AAP0BR85_9ASPA